MQKDSIMPISRHRQKRSLTSVLKGGPSYVHFQPKFWPNPVSYCPIPISYRRSGYLAQILIYLQFLLFIADYEFQSQYMEPISSQKLGTSQILIRPSYELQVI